MRASSLFDQIRATDEYAIRVAHCWAVASGVDATRLDAEREREFSSRTLTCLAIEHLLDATVTAEIFQAQAAILGEPTDMLLADGLRRLRDSSGGVTRLLSRALEVDGRDTGYAAEAWEQRALRTTASVLGAADYALSPADVARAALLDVSAALLDSEHDRMAVPGHLASAIGYATALFMLACELLGRVDAP